MTVEGVVHTASKDSVFPFGATLRGFTVDGIQYFQIHRPDDKYAVAQFDSIDDLKTWLRRALMAVEGLP